MNRVVARASRPFDPKLTGGTPVPLRLHPFRGSKREIPFGRILTLFGGEREMNRARSRVQFMSKTSLRLRVFRLHCISA
jgi:hypothetical protein